MAKRSWIAEELAGCEFDDERLAKRFAKLFRQLSENVLPVSAIVHLVSRTSVHETRYWAMMFWRKLDTRSVPALPMSDRG